jgi:hypothetical protein
MYIHVRQIRIFKFDTDQAQINSGVRNWGRGRECRLVQSLSRPTLAEVSAKAHNASEPETESEAEKLRMGLKLS